MVRRQQTQLTISQVVLFGLVVPQVEQLMVAWLRDVDRALDDDDLVNGVQEVLRRRWPQSSRRGRHGTPAETVLRTLALMGLIRSRRQFLYAANATRSVLSYSPGLT